MKTIIYISGLTILSFVLAVAISITFGCSGNSSQSACCNSNGISNAANNVNEDADKAKDSGEFTFYTCPMHPNVHGEKDGKCPKCGMNLVEKKAKKQTICPVMGNEINKELFADYDGLRVYFCCNGCVKEFKSDPEKYIKKLRDSGVEPETAPKK